MCVCVCESESECQNKNVSVADKPKRALTAYNLFCRVSA